MDDLLKIHSRFVQDTIQLNKYGNHIVTIIPSLIFLTTNFFVIYKFCHRYTSIGFTPLKTWIFRELTFQWSFFYLTKLWFIFLKAFKISITLLCEGLAKDNKRSINTKQCNLLGLFILSMFSTVPLVIFIIKACSRHRIPNFLMWVGEDPWLRTEIGLAGHYLDRPPRFILPPRKDCAYHTRRSSSTEETPQKGTFLRVSKSLESSECKKNKNIQRGY